MEVSTALDKLKKIVTEEKKQLDYIIKGAELLAEMLLADQKQSEQQRTQIEYREPGLEEARNTGERYTV